MAARSTTVKRPMPKQEPFERVRNFDEVALGYTAELAREEAARCLACKKPGCVDGCPVGIDIPGFIRLRRRRRLRRRHPHDQADQRAAGRLRPGLPAGGAVRGICVLGKKGDPVAIGRLERFVADWEAARGRRQRRRRCRPRTAAASRWSGSGPAGITVAADLALLGYEVTMFEALHEAGGVLIYGIPEFRLPKAIVRREVDYVRSLGVELRLDYVVGKTRTDRRGCWRVRRRLRRAPAPACPGSWTSPART